MSASAKIAEQKAPLLACFFFWSIGASLYPSVVGATTGVSTVL